MAAEEFSLKERLRFRKLLEVASSTTFSGERDAALQAAARLAAAHGMTLREASGMREAEEPAPRPKPRNAGPYPADFGAAVREGMGTWWRRGGDEHESYGPSYGYRSESERVAAEKRRRDEAMAEALRRGLDAEERAEAARQEARRKAAARPRRSSAWRSRPEFIRVLLKETAMTAKEIAAAAGVTIYDVFKEKLLMRRA